MTEDFDAKLSYGSNSLGSIVTLFREGIQGDGGWMASIKGAGGTCPSRNNGGGLIQVRWSFVAILLSQLILEKGGRRRGGVRWYSPLEGRREGCSAPVWEGGDLVGGGIVNLIRKEGKL